jgi:hypothetical protein
MEGSLTHLIVYVHRMNVRKIQQIAGLRGVLFRHPKSMIRGDVQRLRVHRHVTQTMERLLIAQSMSKMRFRYTRLHRWQSLVTGRGES